VKADRPRLAFVSPVFLFPNDAGGKIRSTNILRGLKGGAFQVRLLAPASAEQCERWRDEIESVCDDFVPWQPKAPRHRAWRALDLFGELPVNVAADVSRVAAAAVQAQVQRGDVDLMVFDFLHASVLRPRQLPLRSVCFTHNVEAEIFARHAATAKDRIRRWLWQQQTAKMRRFEGTALRAYDKVVAVSERDSAHFKTAYGVTAAEPIPTGVDLDFFSFALPPQVSAPHPPTVVFVGSMDYAPNIAAVEFFLQAVWPLLLSEISELRFRVVGRNPPAALLAMARKSAQVEFTGFVSDVRPHVRDAQVSVIPLQVGGGTRIKVFEAMAMGCPVVSTALGVEGLDVVDGVHFLARDSAQGIARGLLDLIRDTAARNEMSRQARALVESRFGHRVAAQVFEDICQRALAGTPKPT
jgi:glycosyltransferase involved in cell wall biosynthesis